MSGEDTGPLIPSMEELNGREMDYATESAARYATDADRAAPGSFEETSARRMADTMKGHIANLRANPMVGSGRVLNWDTPINYRALPPVELKPTSAEEYERTAQGMREIAARYPVESKSSVWHLEQAELHDGWAAEARCAEDEGRAR